MDNSYKYMVATRCFTYNHAPYILDTLHGFIIQETSFPVVYLVVDDASTDGSQKVILNWSNNNLRSSSDKGLWRTMPYGKLAVGYSENNTQSLFVVILLSENHTQTGRNHEKNSYTFEWLSKAKYMAFCEGDDYWTCPHKLQKQVLLLESNPSLGMVYGQANVFDVDNNHFTDYVTGEKCNGFYDLLFRNCIPTLTACIVSALFLQFIQEYERWDTSRWKMGDYPLWLWLSNKAEIGFIEGPVALYRKHLGSASYSANENARLDFCRSTYVIRRFFGEQYMIPRQLKEKIDRDERIAIANIYLDNHKVKNAIRAVRGGYISDYLIVLSKIVLSYPKMLFKKIIC